MSQPYDEDLVERMKAQFRETPLHALLAIEYIDMENLPADVVSPVGPGGGPVPDGACVVRMPVRADAFGSSGNLHGGAIATLVDVASATAAARNSSYVPGRTRWSPLICTCGTWVDPKAAGWTRWPPSSGPGASWWWWSAGWSIRWATSSPPPTSPPWWCPCASRWPGPPATRRRPSSDLAVVIW